MKEYMEKMEKRERTEGSEAKGRGGREEREGRQKGGKGGKEWEGGDLSRIEIEFSLVINVNNAQSAGFYAHICGGFYLPFFNAYKR